VKKITISNLTQNNYQVGSLHYRVCFNGTIGEKLGLITQQKTCISVKNPYPVLEKMGRKYQYKDRLANTNHIFLSRPDLITRI